MVKIPNIKIPKILLLGEGRNAFSGFLCLGLLRKSHQIGWDFYIWDYFVREKFVAPLFARDS
jgi:hypothetical protein